MRHSDGGLAGSHSEPLTAFRTRAIVVVPGFLSYCVVHDEEHLAALQRQFPGVGGVLRRDIDDDMPPLLNRSSSSGSRSSPAVVLCGLTPDPLDSATTAAAHHISPSYALPTASQAMQYFPFHLDFGPLTWMQCSKMRSELLDVHRQIVAQRNEQQSRRVKTAGQRRQRGGTRRLGSADDTPSSSEDDDDEDDERLPLGEGDNAAATDDVMLLVPVLLESGAESVTNLVAMLGVIGVLCGALKSDVDVDEAFPEMDGVMQWTIPFHDATPYDDAEAHFSLSARDVILAALRGFQRWPSEMLDVNRFVVAHDYFASVEGGDLSWIVPWRVLAFASPDGSEETLAARGHNHSGPDSGELVSGAKPVDYYAQAFSDHRGFYGCVHTVLQLNETPSYPVGPLKARSVHHEALCFPDGSCPPEGVIARFFEIYDAIPTSATATTAGSANPRGKTALALHCMAGLGRTGTLASLILMRDYGFSAHSAIAWCRLCRPGCVIGPQQNFLCWTEALWKRLLLPKAVPRSASMAAHTHKVHANSRSTASRRSASSSVRPDAGEEATEPYASAGVPTTPTAVPGPRPSDTPQSQARLVARPHGAVGAASPETVRVDRSNVVEAAIHRVVDTISSNRLVSSTNRVNAVAASMRPSEQPAPHPVHVASSSAHWSRGSSPVEPVTVRSDAATMMPRYRDASSATVTGGTVVSPPVTASSSTHAQSHDAVGDIRGRPKVTAADRHRRNNKSLSPGSKFRLYTVGHVSQPLQPHLHSTSPSAPKLPSTSANVASGVAQWLDEQRISTQPHQRRGVSGMPGGGVLPATIHRVTVSL